MRPYLARTICWIALAAAAGWGGPSFAADPPGFGSSDVVQLKAKAALESDPALKGLPFWVSVRDGVVLVSGGVPNEATAAKIESLLVHVPGVTVVRVTTWVVPPADPMKALVGEKLAGPVTAGNGSGRAATPHLAVNPILPGNIPDPPPTLPDGFNQPPAARPPEPVVAQRVESAVMGGVLQPPIVTATGTARTPVAIDIPADPVTYPTIRPTRVPVAPADPSPADVALALLTLRKSDPRYAGLTVELRGGSAVVTGTAASAADADAFAAAVAKLPGVGRVTVSAVRVRYRDRKSKRPRAVTGS
jgi:BON domain